MNITFVKSAHKELLRLNKALAQRIVDRIKLLEHDPYGQNSQKLEGGKGYRIRIGDYRVVYTVNKSDESILIIRIAHRRDVYR